MYRANSKILKITLVLRFIKYSGEFWRRGRIFRGTKLFDLIKIQKEGNNEYKDFFFNLGSGNRLFMAASYSVHACGSIVGNYKASRVLWTGSKCGQGVHWQYRPKKGSHGARHRWILLCEVIIIMANTILYCLGIEHGKRIYFSRELTFPPPPSQSFFYDLKNKYFRTLYRVSRKKLPHFI